MKKNKDTKLTSISMAKNIEEIAEFWDTHSLADYWDETEEVEFEVRAKQRHRITLAPIIYEKISIQSHIQGVSPETLVNLWIAERLQKVG